MAEKEQDAKPVAGSGAGDGSGAGGAGSGTGGTGKLGNGAGNGAGAGNAAKSKQGNNSAVKPADLAPSEFQTDADGNLVLKADGSPAKKRGRKPGKATVTKSAPKAKSKSKSGGDKTAMATEMLAAQFQILNTGIAYLTKFDDFALDDGEALQMAEATSNVLGQFDYTPDPKVTAILGLVTTTSMIYGPRLYLYRQHLSEKRSARKVEREQQADEQIVAQMGMPNMGQFSDFGEN